MRGPTTTGGRPINLAKVREREISIYIQFQPYNAVEDVDILPLNWVQTALAPYRPFPTPVLQKTLRPGSGRTHGCI